VTEWLAQWLGEVWWRQWWAWGMLAALFGILELLAPGYIFLGFAIGAGAMAALFLVGAPVTGWLPEGFPALLVVFAILSILAWVGLRLAMGVRKGQRRIIRHDINED
jgi:membrane protein implicated in regulation of membrane protease activity